MNATTYQNLFLHLYEPFPLDELQRSHYSRTKHSTKRISCPSGVYIKPYLGAQPQQHPFYRDCSIPKVVHVARDCGDDVSVLGLETRKDPEAANKSELFQAFLQSRREIALFQDDDEDGEEEDDEGVENADPLAKKDEVTVAKKAAKKRSWFRTLRGIGEKWNTPFYTFQYHKGRFLYEI